ncbi:MAG: UDP-N-acetylglucosamine 1-carboxyvinyltransferase [bacterium]|nr:UDP-N-acetylglucosamine 1-carboxyvinyltransferase [bacterium]
MQKLLIRGPTRLRGTIPASGAKNAALPILAACLLCDEEIELRNVPAVRDIRTMLQLLEHLGVENERLGDAVILRPTGRVSPDEAPYELVKTMRASVLVLGPLLARRGHARVSLPGGCAIGVRPIDLHLTGLEALGAAVELEHGYVETRAGQLEGARFRFPQPTVGGTENLLMAACLARGTTVLENCAREPEIVDLARFLVAMGAGIEGAGEDTITIEGRDRLGGARHSVISDRIQDGTYLIAGVLTRGDVTVEGARPADLAPLLEKLDEIGARVDVGEEHIRVRHEGAIKPRGVVTEPFPGFPTDLQAQYMTLMTQADGVSTVSETVFENRFQHVPELVRMGADIHIDGTYARVHGPSALSGTSVMATDLRASACLVLAGLVAEGETFVHRIYHLDRGYEQMESKLQQLGARVERVD